MREWKFKKQDLNCTLTINDEAIIKIKIKFLEAIVYVH